MSAMVKSVCMTDSEKATLVNAEDFVDSNDCSDTEENYLRNMMFEPEIG
jgi:hypothetical protein